MILLANSERMFNGSFYWTHVGASIADAHIPQHLWWVNLLTSSLLSQAKEGAMIYTLVRSKSRESYVSIILGLH